MSPILFTLSILDPILPNFSEIESHGLEKLRANSRIVFLTSPPAANMSHRAFAKSVHNSVAFSASPNMISKVFIHPVLTASLTESIASLNVLAF